MLLVSLWCHYINRGCMDTKFNPLEMPQIVDDVCYPMRKLDAVYRHYYALYETIDDLTVYGYDYDKLVGSKVSDLISVLTDIAIRSSDEALSHFRGRAANKDL